MDPAAVALLAAGIPALVAASTFTGTHILAARRGTRDKSVGGLLLVADALEAVSVNLTRPAAVAVFRRTDLPLVFACTRLVLVLPKRDRIVWQWMILRAEEVANTKGIARVEIAAEMQGIVFAYISSRRTTCRHLRELSTKMDRPDRFY